MVCHIVPLGSLGTVLFLMGQYKRVLAILRSTTATITVYIGTSSS